MMGRRKYVDLAAVDSTGLESTAASPYFVKRRSRQENPWKTVVYHRYPKLAIVCKTFDQFIIAFKTHRGPKPDVDEFKGLVEQAQRRVDLRVVVADAGYDSESNHTFARQVIGARTIIPASTAVPRTNRRGASTAARCKLDSTKRYMCNELKPRLPSPCSNVVKAITSKAKRTGHNLAT
jgi:hypothetical protein